MESETSLYDTVGGTDALRRLSRTFYEHVLADEVLAPVFANFTPSHVELVAVWLAEVFGGTRSVMGRSKDQSVGPVVGPGLTARVAK